MKELFIARKELKRTLVVNERPIQCPKRVKESSSGK
jgi:hypothetical protein